MSQAGKSDYSWARHRQAGWLVRAENKNLPVWMRAACFALSRHRCSGHAEFAQGELASLLEIDPRNLPKAIATAVSHGFLDGGSCARCLVVPPDLVEMSGWDYRNPRMWCDVHK